MPLKRKSNTEWFYIQQWRAKEEKRIQEQALSSAKFKAGDLVKLASWCKNKHRLAHVVEVSWYDTKSVLIQYVDEAGLFDPPSRAREENLILVERSSG